MAAEPIPKRVFECVLPLAPVAKARARVTRFGTFTPKKTRDFETDVFWMLKDAKAPCFEGPVVVEMVCVFARPKRAPKKGFRFHTVRPDADNAAKSVCDAANLQLWKDDSQIVSLHVIKRYGDTPHIVLKVRDAGIEDVQSMDATA